jgi:hypothetical protein
LKIENQELKMGIGKTNRNQYRKGFQYVQKIPGVIKNRQLMLENCRSRKVVCNPEI